MSDMTIQNAIHCMKAMICEEVCEECDYYGKTGTDHCEADAVRMAIKALEEQPYWTPCSEKKPQLPCLEYLADGSLPRIRLCRSGFYTFNTEEHGRFYVDDEIVSMLEIAMGKGGATRRNGKRNFIESLYQNRIIAWMPLPEAYTGGGDA